MLWHQVNDFSSTNIQMHKKAKMNQQHYSCVGILLKFSKMYLIILSILNNLFKPNL